MPIQFNAPFVSATDQGWGTVITLSVDHNLEAQRYLTIQRAHEFSAEDVRSGMNDVYIETCGQGWSWYGHIEAVELLRGSIRIQLDAEAAAELDDTGEIEVRFDLPEVEFADLRAALQRAFAERPYFADAAA
jgi:immunity protein 10 of polymorphic toxin system